MPSPFILYNTTSASPISHRLVRLQIEQCERRFWDANTNVKNQYKRDYEQLFRKTYQALETMRGMTKARRVREEFRAWALVIDRRDRMQKGIVLMTPPVVVGGDAWDAKAFLYPVSKDKDTYEGKEKADKIKGKSTASGDRQRDRFLANIKRAQASKAATTMRHDTKCRDTNMVSPASKLSAESRAVARKPVLGKLLYQT